MSKYLQGIFKPKNKEKYRGDINTITYRSQIEFAYMRKLDQDTNIISWSSEEYFIPYISPLDGKYHRYFVDLLIERKIDNNTTEVVLIEIKPKSQTIPPVKKKSEKRYLKETIEYNINQAKWDAAKKIANKKGWKFEILTEIDILGRSY